MSSFWAKKNVVGKKKDICTGHEIYGEVDAFTYLFNDA